MAVSGTYSDLYVANQGNNSVVHLTIATNGSLTSADSVTLPEARSQSPSAPTARFFL